MNITISVDGARPVRISGLDGAKGSDIERRLMSLNQLEEEHIRYVLKSTKSLQEACQILGINLSTLWRKRKQFQIS